MASAPKGVAGRWRRWNPGRQTIGAKFINQTEGCEGIADGAVRGSGSARRMYSSLKGCLLGKEEKTRSQKTE
jgi:hypothetical protein